MLYFLTDMQVCMPESLAVSWPLSTGYLSAFTACQHTGGSKHGDTRNYTSVSITRPLHAAVLVFVTQSEERRARALQPYLVATPRRGVVGNSKYADRLRKQVRLMQSQITCLCAAWNSFCTACVGQCMPAGASTGDVKEHPLPACDHRPWR